MLQNIFTVKEEKIIRSRELFDELAGATENERRGIILAKLEQLTGDVLRPLIQETLSDINSLPELLRGNLISKRTETYDSEVPNMAKVQRYGWQVQMVNGVKMQFDPTKEEPVFEPIPTMVIEKTRTLYEVWTNRQAIQKIEELLQAFLVRVRGEFRRMAIDEILEQKRLCELEISKIDRTEMVRETMTEADFSNAGYIKKPKAAGPDDDLFKRFDALQHAV